MDRQRLPGRADPEQKIAAVDVRLLGDTIEVVGVRWTPWGNSGAVLDLVFEYEFLQEQGKDALRDGQFWVVDQATGERLTVWAGAFVPKVILNDSYEGIEHGIATQDVLQHAHGLRPRCAGAGALRAAPGRGRGLDPPL